MPLFCDKCGGPRMNGSGMVYDDGEYYMASHRPGRRVVTYWCRSCVKERIGSEDYNPHD